MKRLAPDPRLVGINVEGVSLGPLDAHRDLYILILKGLNHISDPYTAKQTLNKFGLSSLITTIKELCGPHVVEPVDVRLCDLLLVIQLTKTLLLSDDVREIKIGTWFERFQRTSEYIENKEGIWDGITDYLGQYGAVPKGEDGNRILTIKHKSADMTAEAVTKVNRRIQIGSKYPETLLKDLKLPFNRPIIYVKEELKRANITVAYSASHIANNGKLRATFKTDCMTYPGVWTCTSGVFEEFTERKMCFRVFALDEFVSRYPDIEPMNVNEHWKRKNVRRYHGLLTKWKNKPVVLAGPPITFWWFKDDRGSQRRIGELFQKHGLTYGTEEKPESIDHENMGQLSLF